MIEHATLPVGVWVCAAILITIAYFEWGVTSEE